jgi:hypothetical protein
LCESINFYFQGLAAGKPVTTGAISLTGVETGVSKGV